MDFADFRSGELRALRDSLKRLSHHDRTGLEVVTVSGGSGVGKTTLMKRARQEVMGSAKHHVIYGGHNQHRSSQHEPHRDFILCTIDRLCQQMVRDSKEKAQSVGRFLARSCDATELSVLVSTFPILERLVPLEKQFHSSSSSMSPWVLERLKATLPVLIKGIANLDRPIVLVLDDLHLATRASISLLEAICIHGGKTKDLLIWCAFVNDNNNPSDYSSIYKQGDNGLHELWETIRQQEQSKIQLSDFSESEVNEIVAIWTGTSLGESRGLSAAIFGKTRGNPFCLNHFCSALREQGLVRRHDDKDHSRWTWNAQQVERVDYGKHDMMELFRVRLSCLPPSVGLALKAGSCMGLEFDASVVAMILDLQLISPNDGLQHGNQRLHELSVAVKQGFLEQQQQPGTNQYRFAHIDMRHAAYSLLVDRSRVHVSIGRYLQTKLRDTPEPPRTLVFLATDQLNLGSEYLRELPQEQSSLARLNVWAGELALQQNSFAIAADYFVIAIGLLESGWENGLYELKVRVYTLLVRAESAAGNYRNSIKVAQAALRHTKLVHDMHPLFQQRLEALAALSRAAECLHLGVQFLRRLGVKIPLQANKVQVIVQKIKTIRRLKGSNNERILTLEPASDLLKIAAMKMLHTLSTVAHQAQRADLYAILVLKHVSLCLKHGLAAESGAALVAYGTLVSRLLGSLEEGYAIGRTALLAGDSLPRVEHLRYRLLTTWQFHADMGHLREPVPRCLGSLLRAYHWAMEIGDLPSSMRCAALSVSMQFHSGCQDLSTLLKDIVAFSTGAAPGHQSSLDVVRIYQQAALALTGASLSRVMLTGEAMSEQEIEKSCVWSTIQWMWFIKLLLAIYFNEISLAADLLVTMQQGTAASSSAFGSTMFHMPILAWAETLTCLATAHATGQRKHKRKSRKLLRRVEHLLGGGSTTNSHHHHRLLLLYAERTVLRHSTDVRLVRELYDVAINASHDFINDQALANERAGTFLMSRQEEDLARPYIQRAYQLYEQWGATAKCQQIWNQHSKLLRT